MYIIVYILYYCYTMVMYIIVAQCMYVRSCLGRISLLYNKITYLAIYDNRINLLSHAVISITN